MTDHDRIDRILSLLSLYWHARPGFRLGQVVGNFTPTTHLGGETYQFGDSYLVEDAVIEERLRAAIAALDFKPIARHPAGCVAYANAVCAWLRDGTKVVLQRDADTKGRAWLEVEPQSTVHLAGEALAPDPPRDPLGLEMCPGITPPQEEECNPLGDLLRIIDDIEDGKEPEASPEMLALAEQVCRTRKPHETDEQWAQRLAGELVEAGIEDDNQWKDTGSRRWVKVQKRNDWQHDTYFYLDEGKERPLSGSGAPGVLRSVAVRWPDGLEDRLNVSLRTEHRRAYEQGPGPYAVQSPVLEVGVILHGVEVSLNLSEFEIDPASCEWDKSNE